MILVLCDETDVSALWAAQALRARGLSPTVVTGADLAATQRGEHRVETRTVDCEIKLASGVVLHSPEVHAVLNRLPCRLPSCASRAIGPYPPRSLRSFAQYSSRFEISRSKPRSTGS